MVAPPMHRIDVTMHYFFVPNRILWEHWEQFITNTPEEITGLPFDFPIVNIDELGVNYTSLLDYLGIPRVPAGATALEKISALPIAAYNMIYDEYYRDQNLQDKIFTPLVDGDNSSILSMAVKLRAWEHDYFTSALPFAQKGDVVDIPIGGFSDVPVAYNASVGATTTLTGSGVDPVVPSRPADAGAGSVVVPADALYAETSLMATESTTINDLRRAFRLQEWLEKAARGGSRYIENILIMFGVRSSDKRLNRPEYITGTKSPVVISEVLNTSDTTENPQGNMSGHGVSVTGGKYGSYYCEEHGYIIGIMSVIPKTAYSDGVAKHWLKRDAFDFYWPSFANIGEQPVLNRELYAFTNVGGETFGYVPRYAEYKYMPSRVAGDFRTSLDFWHLGRQFNALPVLDETFIECRPGARIFAVTDPVVQKLYCHILHKIRAVRSMPKYGTPTF